MRSRHFLHRFLSQKHETYPHPWAVALCATLLALCTLKVDVAGVFASACIGALFAINGRVPAQIMLGALAAGAISQIGAVIPLAYWAVLLQAIVVALVPRRFVTVVSILPRWAWLIISVVATISICAMLLGFGAVPTIVALVTCGYLGINITRNLAMSDAHLLNWGDNSLFTVTRDLLLGRVTSGMLHDLSQPLNVISMANGNMGYIVDQLDMGDDDRKELQDRITRVAHHTQNAAAILSLFRWFGRDGSDNVGQLTVRSAIERAIAATRSNVRHHDVTVEVVGNGLDYLLPSRHGSLEIISVAGLLCAFSSFIETDGHEKRGTVLIVASMMASKLEVSIRCTDEHGQPLPSRSMDHATGWLVEQVAEEAAGEFRVNQRAGDPEHFRIRFKRDDV